MIKSYGVAASNGLWLAQKMLYEMYLEGRNVSKSEEHAAIWLELAAGKGDAVAIQTLAGLYEKGVVKCEDEKSIGVLYDRAAMAYIKQWQAVTVYEVDEVDKRMAEFNGCDFSKVAWYNMTDSELDSAIRECFEKAVSHGNTEAEDHYMQYKKEMDDYKKRGPCPDIFRVGIDVKADDEKNLSKEGESK